MPVRMIRLILILISLLLPTAVVQAQTVNTPAVSNPLLRAELLNRVKQTEIMLNRLLKCSAELPECDASIDRMKKTYADNALRLKEIVQQYGWPGNDLVGHDGAMAATLILLEADLALKKEMLPLVKGAYDAGKTHGTNYAVLLDNIRVAEGKPQVYGTQSMVDGRVFSLEDEANVENIVPK